MANKKLPLMVENLTVHLGAFTLDNISFKVQPGKITGFLGHNGAGKTTTLRTIMGMVRKDGGTVRIGESDHIQNEQDFKAKIGFVPEESFFYSKMTIRQLMDFVSGFHPNWDHQACEDLMEVLSLDPKKKISELSKGMKMKTNFLLSQGHNPHVLLFDEPTSGLDPRSRVVVLDCMEKAAHQEGRAVLFSTHNLFEVEKIADRVIIIRDGAILSDCDLSELKSKDSTEKKWSLENHFLELTG